MTASSQASFDWFRTPPAPGDPGILMIVDTHPGPADLTTLSIQADINPAHPNTCHPEL